MIIGLGNPGVEYKNSRHNIGFRLVFSLSEKYRIGLTNLRYLARWGEGLILSQPVVLAKPRTFMNRSGKAVGDFNLRHLLGNIIERPKDCGPVRI